MFFNSAVFRTVGRVLLAGTLCVLAVAFAMEAKMSWYGPAAGLKSEITDAKAMPADVPRLVAHGVAAPVPAAPQIHFFIPFVLILATWRCTGLFPQLPMASIPFEDVRHSFFSPLLFFRPPPAIF